MKRLLLYICILMLFLCFNCPEKPVENAIIDPPVNVKQETVLTGADQLDVLVPKLAGKRVALVVNYTAIVGTKHLADTLKALGVELVKVFAPEHGFRGNAAAGEHVKDGKDAQLGLTVESLYDNNRKPTAAQLSDIDVMVYDIQDVGVRFYTYLGTMHYVMEACAEHGKKLIVLDRPDPNGSYVDGPVLQLAHKSFIGMHPVPVVHGLTSGEYAQMLNGEGWLDGSRKCELEVIPVKNWTHKDHYSLPVKPSPNLPNDQAIRLYPSICFFECTVISVGRGTETPFQVIGNPELKNMPYQFTPVTIKGMALNPPHENKLCYGLDLRNVPVEKKVDLKYLINMYNAYPEKDKFFLKNFARWAGNTLLEEQIKKGMTEEQIRETWQPDLDKYKAMRRKYLLYAD